MIHRSALVFLVVQMALGLTLSSCGGGGSENPSGSTRQTPGGVLSSFAGAAASGDNAAALLNFTQETRDALRQPLSDRRNLSALGDSLRKAVEHKKTDSTAIYKSSYDDNGVSCTFYIHLVKDDDGNWKISGF